MQLQLMFVLTHPAIPGLILDIPDLFIPTNMLYLNQLLAMR